jgi:acetyl esterase/lipase
LPFLQLGWVVVNVDYRPATVSLAPGAVEDCLHALRWVSVNAAEYDIDTHQLVLAGLSAGGHLALTTGMLPRSRDMYESPGVSEESVACPTLQSFRLWTDTICPIAIVSWCGITDVAELIEGPHVQGFAVAWVGDRPNRRAVAEEVSPIRYVRAGLPPIVTVHGDSDKDVPHGQAVRFHQLLSAAGVRNKLITAHGAGHNLDAQALAKSYPRVFDFLRMSGVSVTAYQGKGL